LLNLRLFPGAWFVQLCRRADQSVRLVHALQSEGLRRPPIRLTVVLWRIVAAKRQATWLSTDFLLRRIEIPIAPKPTSIIAQVDGSGTPLLIDPNRPPSSKPT
jgi:hypothetical protein